MRPSMGCGVLTLLAALGCASMDSAQAPSPVASDGLVMEMEEKVAFGYAGGAEDNDDAPPPPPPPEAAAAVGKRFRAADKAKKEEGEVRAEPEEPEPESDEEAPDDGDAGTTRSWFPESFLWQPLVETDATGSAEVVVRVPDQLTTWRVLALAHTRDGQQAGAVHTFDSALPLYVDPVVPAWLHAGDVLELPIQAVGLSGAETPAELRVRTEGPLEGSGIAELLVPGDGSVFETLTVTATGAGDARVRAALTSPLGDDAAERVVPVIPRGRPVSKDVGGTLSGERSLRLVGPRTADPATQQLQVRVFPGPLAVLQAEVGRALSGGVTPGYGFVLATHLVELGERTGADVDDDAVRRLQILGWQRIVQAARAPSTGQAADLLAVVGGVRGHALAEQLAPRLAHTVGQGQRGDGTFARAPSAPLRQVIVDTAWSARALPADAEVARARAAGALERYAGQIEDAYTAAVVLATGLVDEAQAERLRSLVTDGMSTTADGTTVVSTPNGARNPWGYGPSRAEMLAWTWLAMHAHVEPSVSGDLVAGLMQGYDVRGGFGAGAADVVALEAVLGGLPVLDRPVDVVLALDGEVVARAPVDPAQPKVPALLEAMPGGGDPRITLRTEPPVPGLAYVATLASWVPWTGDEGLPGVDIEVATSELAVGDAGTVTLTVAAPSKTSVELEVGLPAGATVDEARLGALVGQGVLSSYQIGSDRVTLRTKTFGAGELLEVPVGVTPAFAGRFAARPLVVRASGREAVLPPNEWTVRAPGG